MSATLWTVLGVVAFQTGVVMAVYLTYRRKRAAISLSYTAFRVVYIGAAIILTAGPIAAALSLNRPEPYATPVGSVDPRAVVGVGTDAWVVGFGLYLASFLVLGIADRMEGR